MQGLQAQLGLVLRRGVDRAALEDPGQGKARRLREIRDIECTTDTLHTLGTNGGTKEKKKKNVSHFFFVVLQAVILIALLHFFRYFEISESFFYRGKVVFDAK